jgi:hypothetical protein
MADPKSQPQRSYVGGSLAIVGKPNSTEFPTPNLRDRILVVRRDSRKAGYKVPLQGSKYDGPNAEKFCDFKFATIKSLDQIGWENWYYVNERRNQNAYNFEISYPYASKDYPTITRTYVFLRGDQRSKEPDADTMDPVYGDLFLTDHKVIRLQQPELDALFVGIQRTYERLPGPIIISDQTNQFQQEVTVAEQEDIAPDFPVVTALTESAKLERKTTAKAKTTNATVDSVFPETAYKVSRDDAVVPYRHRKFLGALPSVQISQTLAGQAHVPSLADVNWDASDHQTTLYKHQVSTTSRFLVAPIALLEYRLTPEQQLSTTTETWARGLQSFTPSPLLIEADVIQLGNNESIKSVTTIPDVFPQVVYEAEIPDPVPLKFKVAIPVFATTYTSTGAAAPPALGTGELMRRDEQTKEFWHRLMIKGRDIGQLPRSLVSYELTPEQQVATVTEVLAAGLQTLSPNELLLKGSVDNLGNNTSLKSTTTTVDVFDRREFTVSIPDFLPERFRVAVPVTESSATLPSPNPVTIPVLGTGDLEAKVTQEKEFWKRVSLKTRGNVVRTVLVSYKMTRDKQIETVVETFNSGIQTISPNALTIEADVTNLGNNTSLSNVGTVQNLFTEPSFEVTIPDLVPPEFKASVPTRITESLIPGNAALPILGTGDISHTEKQVNEFVYRDRLETRSGISLPKTFVNLELTKEFGGGDTNILRTLALGSQSLDEGLVVLRSEVKDLGNGMSLKETQQLNGLGWPALPSLLWDDNMRVQYSETKQVVPKGTAPSSDTGYAGLSEVKSIDTWRSLLTTTNKPARYYSVDTALITREFRPYRFPGYLQFSGTGYYTRAATAVLVEHVIRTWWVNSSSTPTITYDRIVTGDVIINNLALTGLEYARNVLHDGFSFGILSYPATTPSASEYTGALNGLAPGNYQIASLYTPGSAGGYTAGETITVSDGRGHTMQTTVLSVYDVGTIHGIIGSLSANGTGNFPPGGYGPFPGSGGSGQGALFNVSAFNIPAFVGGPWIGTLRIIDASVVPEKEPNMWKCQTKSVVMQ